MEDGGDHWKEMQCKQVFEDELAKILDQIQAEQGIELKAYEMIRSKILGTYEPKNIVRKVGFH